MYCTLPTNTKQQIQSEQLSGEHSGAFSSLSARCFPQMVVGIKMELKEWILDLDLSNISL